MSATQEFNSPEINEDDYYERLGAPSTADAGDIDDHTKKYVREFKPELSSHENADERWKRFNSARQTLNSADTKEDYDIFRERFGADRASDAYEAWQAAEQQLGPPDSVSAHELGIEPETDDSGSRSRKRSRRDRQSSGRQRRSSRKEREQERQERREAGETDIDTDSSKTYSTHATDNERESSTDASSGAEASASGTFGRVFDRVRSTIDLAAMEASTMLSLVDLVVIGYLLYSVLVEVVLGSFSSQLVRNAGTVLVGGAVIGGLSWEYLDRFDDRLTTGGTTSVGNHFERSSKPARLLLLPTVSAALWSLVLLGGGGAFTVLLLAVSVVSLYGRLRGIQRTVDLPAWVRYVEPVGAVFATVTFVTLFVQGGGSTATGGLLTTAETPVLVGFGALLLAIIGAPIVAAGRRLTE